MGVDISWHDGLTTILDNSEIKPNEIELYINGTYSSLNIMQYYNIFQYKFNKSGLYILDTNIKKALTSMRWMFTSEFLISISCGIYRHEIFNKLK